MYQMHQKCAAVDYEDFGLSPETMELIDDALKLCEDPRYKPSKRSLKKMKSLEVKLPLMHKNIVEIMKLFKRCTESANLFLQFYESWSEKRKESIQKLEEIANTLRKIRLDCNIAKLWGASVGVVGAITAIAGAILIPFTLGLSTPMMVAGTATGLAGGATSFGTAITELAILQHKVKEVQEVLKVDGEEFQPLSQWFVHSTDFLEAVEKVMSIDAFQRLLTDIMQVMSAFDNPGQNHNNIDIHHYTRTIIFSLLNSLGNQMPMGLMMILSILTNSKTYKLFNEIVKTHKTSPMIFEAVAMTTKLITQAVRGVEMAISVASGAGAAVRIGGFAVRAAVARAFAQGLLAGVALALDITSLVLTSIDYHKGSKCPKAEAIQNAATVMKEELDIATHVRSNLTYIKAKQCLRYN